MIDILTSYSSAMQDISTLSSRASEDASLMLDDSWRTELAMALVQLQNSGEDVRALDPPERYEDLHADMVEASNHYDRAVDLMVAGIDELDPDKITQASEEMQLGTEAMNRAQEKFAQLHD